MNDYRNESRNESRNECCLKESICRYIGQTVTIFTTSGGISGSGFTGVLASVNDNCIKLITDIGAAPACPIGGPCVPQNNCCFGFGSGRTQCCKSNAWLGSVTEIPICKVVSFTHNAI